MLSAKATGQGSAARKYDLITAIGAFGLARDKHLQRLMLRLITLITARYNWARDELAVGQREIGMLWSVDERTVKREMAKLRGLGWLVVRRQGARGRVTQYSLDIDCILLATKSQWQNVGPDFDLRMQGAPDTGQILRLPVIGVVPPPKVMDGTEWEIAQTVLYAEDRAVYGSWLRALVREGRAGGRIVLKAPSRFHGAYVQTHLSGRILTACQSVDADVSEIAIIS